MSIPLMTAIILISFLILLVMGFPVAFSLLGLSLIFMFIFISPDTTYAAYTGIFRVTTLDIYLALPLFVVMATLLQHSGVGERLYDMMYKWFGGLRGGLAIGTVFICTIIAATTGLGATGVVTIGRLAYPEMQRRGYHPLIGLGCIPAGSSLGPLIPPSVLMIIIGGFGGLSIGALFMGGIFPGLLMSFLFIAYIAIACWRRPQLAPAMPPEERASWREKFVALRGVILPTLLIIVVLGSIWLGVATPSEAGGVGAFGALVCAAIYRQLNWENLKRATFSALTVTCMVMWLLMGGTTFSSLLIFTGVSKYLAEFMVGLGTNPIVHITVMMIIGLVLGCFIDAAAISMITLPIFMPIVFALGIDPIWFALLFTINMIIGFITPPFGICLFYTKGIVPSDVTMGDIYRSVAPYVVCMLLVLIIGILWPPLLTWLPNKMIK